ncbi:MAG: biotin--[acetyl-CoA-carboxylase] ligase [Candidatus Omnitrophica bacterium]|jgi:BirA family biotin operon repressor/biotin-[acetyl-CoA-carboxylase] ligase|nr:biotin--[acetyl-CoA-carboxylase] ligase [Candidatus Omnitrophota bacterium]
MTPEERIIDLLRGKSEHVSGEEISVRLGISRQALWKHIQQLKDAGYDIQAVPHLGYTLISCPDRLFPQEVKHGLNTKTIGRKIYYYDSLSSTMDVAIKLGMDNHPEGGVVLAEAQNKGRGRLGRSWASPKYKGICASVILRPKILPSKTSILTLLIGVSICQAVEELTGISAQIKWPNDIFIKNKKLAGILTELSAEADLVHFLVVGFGINVNDTPANVADAICLKSCTNTAVERVLLLQECLRKIECNYLLFQKGDFKSIIDKWRDINITLGKRVKVCLKGKQIQGQALDIDDDGGLLVRRDSGITEKIMAGDIIHCR